MRTYIKFLICICCFITGLSLSAQDSLYYRQTIAQLTSDDFHGRGYAFKGDSIAARFIASEFEKFKLEKWTPDYYQPYFLNMNTFEGETYFSFGETFPAPELFENAQFMAYSHSTKGVFSVKTIKAKEVYKQKKRKFKNQENLFLLIDISDLDTKDSIQKEIYNAVLRAANLNMYQVKGYILVSKNLLPWHLAYGKLQLEHLTLNVTKEYVKTTPKKIEVNVESKYIENYETQNVCGYIKGKTYPDSFFVCIAHYDHLGRFGKDYVFYGANDNASGAAFVLDLARHYSQAQHQPDYSIAFLIVSGEEIGLLGSMYYVDHSFFPIAHIKTAINFDMVGTGEDGITMVCGKAFPEEFEKFKTLNQTHNYLSKVVDREATNNSDHYPFYREGAKAFFIYGMGKSGRYHHTSDVLGNLSLGGYTGLFKLITDYFNLYQIK